jgi:tetratricopeptide (TPR) repeat protein
MSRMRASTRLSIAGVALLLATGPCVSTQSQTQAPPPPSPQHSPSPFEREKARALDALFAALQKAASDADADLIVSEIRAIWERSGATDIDLLMTRAAAAIQGLNYGLADILLEAVIEDAPFFAEGWNRRATLRFLMGDYAASLADIDKVLALEPRHFGALAIRGLIHMAAERWAEALAAFRTALSVNPFLKERHDVIPELERKTERGKL